MCWRSEGISREIRSTRLTRTSQSGARSSQSTTTMVERSAGSCSMYQVNASLARMYVLPVVATLPTVASPIRPGQGPSSRARRRRSPVTAGATVRRWRARQARSAGTTSWPNCGAWWTRPSPGAATCCCWRGRRASGRRRCLPRRPTLRRAAGPGWPGAGAGPARARPVTGRGSRSCGSSGWTSRGPRGSGQPVRDAPASERFRLFDEVTSLLLAESRIQPLLLLLDDLQWADQPSQLLLDFLARRLPAGAVAVAGSYRDTEPAPGRRRVRRWPRWRRGPPCCR